MYDVRFPLPRSWFYGVGGVLAVIAAMAVGFGLARPTSSDEAEVEAPAAMAERSTGDVVASTDFPAFAPQGVIVVDAPSPPPEREVAAVDPTAARPSTRAEELSVRRARAALNRAPTTERETQTQVQVARADTTAPSAVSDAGPVEAAPPEDVSREEAEPMDDGATEQNSADNRSWYGSAEYRREVAEQQRAEREARRRRNEGWW